MRKETLYVIRNNRNTIFSNPTNEIDQDDPLFEALERLSSGAASTLLDCLGWKRKRRYKGVSGRVREEWTRIARQPAEEVFWA